MNSHPWSVKLTPDLEQFAREIGNGNLSQGIRVALIQLQGIRQSERTKITPLETMSSHCPHCGKLNISGIKTQDYCVHFRMASSEGFRFEGGSQ